MERPVSVSASTIPAQAGLERDTIAAIATGAAMGGIGIVRLSGPSALRIGQTITASTLAVRHAHYRRFLNDDGTTIDDGIALFFPGPASFTGEDVVELQGHGGTVVLQLLLERILALGARQARPGEFSERAFLNNRLDLTQAEAIADLISAKTKSAVRQAQASLSGEFSAAIDTFNQEVTALRVFVEAAIDFPEEEIDFLADGQVKRRLSGLLEQGQILIEKTQKSAIRQRGATVVLAGKPNAGKSSLLNRLSGENSAIVTDTPGTTRDIVRESIEINGVPLIITDTAGLRDTLDPIESEGVRRARQEISHADLVLYLHDDTQGNICEPPLSDNPMLGILTKTDLSGRIAGEVSTDRRNMEWIGISSATGAGIDELRGQIARFLGVNQTESTRYSARERHVAILKKVNAHLEITTHQFLTSGAGELLAEDLRQIHDQLGEITGRVSSNDLLGEIFSSFCIGK